MKYLIIYGSCGHGHQRAAEYVAEELKNRGENDVTIIDFLEYTTSFFKKTYPLIYRFSVMKIPLLWKLGFDVTNIKFLYPLFQPIRRIANHFHAKKLEEYVIQENPGYVILTHFLPSEICSALKKKKRISSHVVTIVTDTIAHMTWINKYSDYFIGFADETKKGLARWGIEEKRIQTFGIPISEKFAIEGKQKEYCQKHGLDGELFTVLITSGSFGMGPIEKLVMQLETFKGRVQVLVVCGNNKALFQSLSEKQFSIPVKVFGFVDCMHELMEAADIAIAKSGGLTMCESLAKELPLIISKPIPGQETYNARFLVAHGAAFRIRHAHEAEQIIRSILHEPQILIEKKNNIRSIKKQNATKDIVTFLQTLKSN